MGDKTYTLQAQPNGPGIDPRAPRFGANITWVLLLVVLFLNLVEGPGIRPGETGGVLARPSFWLLLVVTLLFAWGAFLGAKTHPYSVLFRAVVRPRLAPPEQLENPRPPRFAQLVGFVFTAVALVLALLGVPWGLFAPTAVAFVAAFLNGVFGYCLGCEVYLLLARAKLVKL
ncbi:DUF4395 domain-containing protein [Pseudoclavibacter sp. CFCC 13611]|uniref:DUF4395 domain-containing protein n=1 Tax=Pseudoclavibacter sp. CFCC 13611 TaxID=2615178 RepID=UPI001300F251|nr:DUF4395 domain-containing protein [Pseudoclavibacter sp. CFCC 13611]KAB1664452.1 DUF4395 domain-containing protein [Pseudoclavibacter sp. CFCC 13611]